MQLIIEDFSKPISGFLQTRMMYVGVINQKVIRGYLEESKKQQVSIDFFGAHSDNSNQKYFFAKYAAAFHSRFQAYMETESNRTDLRECSLQLHKVFSPRTQFVTDIKLQNYAMQMNDLCVGIYFLLRMSFKRSDASVRKKIGQLGELVQMDAKSDKFAVFPKSGRHFKYLIFLSAIAFGLVERHNFVSQFGKLQGMYEVICSRWRACKNEISDLQQKRNTVSFNDHDRERLVQLKKKSEIFETRSGLSEEKDRRLKGLKQRADEKLQEKYREQKRESMLEENIVNEKRFLLCMYPFVSAP